jgi:hypothetical protein
MTITMDYYVPNKGSITVCHCAKFDLSLTGIFPAFALLINNVGVGQIASECGHWISINASMVICAAACPNRNIYRGNTGNKGATYC